MGKLLYDGEEHPIILEDRTLAHLKIVIVTKLRRLESFTVSWKHPADQPAGRSTIWMHPSIPLQFSFDDEEPTDINERWIHDLMHSANSSGGITLVDEVIDGPD